MSMQHTAADGGPAGLGLLFADDDESFRRIMGRALARRGYRVQLAADVTSALELARRAPPARAVVDLRMPGESGLTLVRELLAINPDCRIVVLSGYASIATAVQAIKLGALDYLAKPVNADEVQAALEAKATGASSHDEGNAMLSATTLSVSRLEWEHIQRVLHAHGGNISATARALNMHRRTLQRKLAKHPVRR